MAADLMKIAERLRFEAERTSDSASRDVMLRAVDGIGRVADISSRNIASRKIQEIIKALEDAAIEAMLRENEAMYSIGFCHNSALKCAGISVGIGSRKLQRSVHEAVSLLRGIAGCE